MRKEEDYRRTVEWFRADDHWRVSNSNTINCFSRVPGGSLKAIVVSICEENLGRVPLFSNKAMLAFQCALQGDYSQLGSLYSELMQKRIMEKLRESGGGV